MYIINQIKGGLLLSAGEMPKGSIIAFDQQTLTTLKFQLVNTLVLIVVLTLILYKPVKKFLDERSQGIADDIDSASLTKKEAEELKVQYEQKLLEIEIEKEKILSTAHQKALERSDHIIKEAKEEAEHIYQYSMAELKEKQLAADEEIKRQLIEISVLVAGKFIENSIDEETQDKYIAEALDNWEEGAMARLGQDKYTEEMLKLVRGNPSITQTYHQALQISKGEIEENSPDITSELKWFIELIDEPDVKPVLNKLVDFMRIRLRILNVDVISAVELKKQQLLTIEQKLVKTLSRQVVIHNIIDSTIIGGLRIIIGDKVIDNSIRTQLKNIKAELYKGVYFNNEINS